MKKFILTIAAVLCGIAAFAYEPEIRKIDIACTLDSLGAAHIVETWDVTVASGTEWYLVRNNLGDIKIKDLTVSEGDEVFVTESYWDLDRSINQKKGRCGINKTSKGCEICWGVGSYGDHIFKVSYTMTNAVKSCYDYDMLHLQFISDGLSSTPKEANLTVEVTGTQLDTAVARTWAFGYIGKVGFHKGMAIAFSTEEFDDNSSMILLLRLDKGIIKSPQSSYSCYFQERLDMALEGSHFDDDIEESGPQTMSDKFYDWLSNFFAFLFMGGWIFFLPIFSWLAIRKTRRKYLGTASPQTIPWNREIPFKGNLLATNYILKEIGLTNKKNTIASAMILKMIQIGAIVVKQKVDVTSEKVELAFGSSELVQDLPAPMKGLWEMMVEASGGDLILQEKEFSKWSKSHTEKVSKWVKSVEYAGKAAINAQPYRAGNTMTVICREEARKAVGLRKFLTEYTLIKERASQEVILWQDYMVFAALFGVADKVAKELKDIDPKAFEEAVQGKSVSVGRVINMSDSLARAITAAKLAEDSKSTGGGSGGGSRGGYGGHSSYHGGGGFSGGGRGGGSR